MANPPPRRNQGWRYYLMRHFKPYKGTNRCLAGQGSAKQSLEDTRFSFYVNYMVIFIKGEEFAVLFCTCNLNAT